MHGKDCQMPLKPFCYQGQIRDVTPITPLPQPPIFICVLKSDLSFFAKNTKNVLLISFSCILVYICAVFNKMKK